MSRYKIQVLALSGVVAGRSRFCATQKEAIQRARMETSGCRDRAVVLFRDAEVWRVYVCGRCTRY